MAAYVRSHASVLDNQDQKQELKRSNDSKNYAHKYDRLTRQSFSPIDRYPLPAVPALTGDNLTGSCHKKLTTQLGTRCTYVRVEDRFCASVDMHARALYVPTKYYSIFGGQ